MTISARLKLAALVPAFMALIISLALFLSYRVVEVAQEKDRTAQRIMLGIQELNSLAHAYMLHHEERPKQQFLQVYENISRVIAAARFKNGEQALLENIRRNSELMEASFIRLVANYERLGSSRDSALLREAEERLAGQLDIRSRHMASAASRLESMIDDEILATQKRISALTLVLVIALAVPFTIVLLRMMRSIAVSLATLRKGTELIGGGNLEHRIGMTSPDELGQLSGSFDRMTGQLQEATVSKDQLLNEIAERKQAEAALRESEERFRLMGDTIPYGAWMADAEGRNIYISPLFLELVGMTFEQVKEFGWTGKMPPEDVEPTMRRWMECVRTGCDWEGELRFPSPDGQWHTILSRGRPVRDAQGRIKAWVGINLDITERKRTEEALRRAHDELELRVRERTKELVAAGDSVKAERQRLSSVLETLPVYVVLLDKDYRVPFANRFFRERFGDSCGKRCYEYLFKRAEPCEVCETYTVLKTNAPHHWYWTGPDGRDYDIYDFPFIDADGSTMILEMGIDITEQKLAQKALGEINDTLEQRIAERIAELRTANESIRASRVAALNMMEDAVQARKKAEETSVELRKEIAERKHAEEALREAESKLRAIFNISADAIGVSKNGLHVFANPAYISLFGCASQEEIIGRSIIDLIAPSERRRIRENVQRRNSGEPAPSCYETRGLRTDGSEFDMDVRASTYQSGDGTYVVVILRDITERKKAEADLLKLSEEMAARNVELEYANREMEAFIYSISHDLRAPIRTMSGFAKILNEDYAGKLDAQGLDYLKRIVRGSAKATQLIDDLLNLSKISRQEPDRMEVDLSKKASKILEQLREINPARDVEVIVQDGLSASGDPRLVELVLSNLLGNAWKFTSKTENARIEFGKIESQVPGLESRVSSSEPETRNPKLETVFYVKDNGAGFDPKYADKMFWPFHRLHSEQEFEGTGIGLTIVERIIRRHGGRIWAEGEPEKGAMFYFTL